jgi:hypothetical protein
LAENGINHKSNPTLCRTGFPKEAVPKYELDFIMKLSRLDRVEVLALLKKHRWDREALFVELASSSKMR